VRVTRATDSVHHAGSLRLAQIGARGGLLEGSRHGQDWRAGSDWMRRGERGLGAEERPGRSRSAKQRRCEEEGQEADGGPGVSEERVGRRGYWFRPGQALGPGEREGKEKAGARGPLGR
jgi:hypothetical protein